MLPGGGAVRTVDHPLTFVATDTVRAMSGFAFRDATAADAPRLGRSVAEAFERYREFAPSDWQPPPAATQTGRLAELLGRADVWCRVAEHDGELAGYVCVIPATLSVFAREEPSLAHLRLMFVEPPYWGSGLAKTLHDAAITEAAERGYTAIRLFTPTGQARARRFYQREGWREAADPFDADFGLPTIEYRRPVP